MQRRAEHDRLAATVQRLQAEVDGLRRSQRHRAVIEQAKGLLVGRLGCTPDEAFTHLSHISQQSHLKVAEVAAGLLGIAAPMPEPSALGAEGDGFRPERYVTPASEAAAADRDGAAPVVSLLPEEITARYHLACAALSSVDDAATLAEVAWSEGLRHLGVAAVLIAVLEPDGAVRLVSTHGVPKVLASAWQRVPGTLKVAFLQAVVNGRPLWIDGKGAAELGYELLVDGGVRACIPLRDRGRAFGVASIIWPTDDLPEPGMRAYVSAIAEACGRRLSQLLRDPHGAPVASPAAHWVEAVLETLPGSFALLAPVRDDTGQIIDFRFDRCSPEATDAGGRLADDFCGRRVLDLYPHVVGVGVFDGYLQALCTGRPFQLPPTPMSVRTPDGERLVVMSMRAARFGDGVLVHWQYHDAERRLRSHLDRVQRAAGAGWMEWDLTSGQVTWSQAAYRILQRDPGHGAIKLASLPRYVAADDAAALSAAVQRLTRARQPLDCTVRLQRGGTPSVVRLVADPVVADSGRVVAVHGAVHLVSGDRGAQAGARRLA
ncbi:ANTAR domain-containing protein [Couchioplanes caeruleus]|uniref:ANTAR domain-containing protein n=1 Tax=Couchioplanes caeruleus TaxID=56438 RepID=UPI00201C048B|nr:ANTAR domain-containing protein [Couchioplanes caeruleus]UQU62650.1 ANTAR domain-containing protein [Couchioplanes caeruleus]